MDRALRDCLAGKEFNYILPFFWLHGESHEALREEMLAIRRSGCLSFCAESRPYPDFCGEQWWEDFGFILKTARELGMQVWLLDDAHFPTGYANGGVERNPHLRKRSVRCETVDVQGPQKEVALLWDHYTKEGDVLVQAVAYRRSGEGMDCTGEPIDLMPSRRDGLVFFDVPEGLWRVFFILETDRFLGGMPHHIDMLNPASTELMISEVYEPQFAHFAEYFGNTFRGFFSDEPGFLNTSGNYIGTLGRETPYPWRSDLPERMAQKLGKTPDEVRRMLPMLWTKIDDVGDFRVAYMDTVTTLYAQNFTEKLGGWCRSHGVEYIGHIIEDMGSCSRLGHSAGHYFRSLDAQDMAGIDVVLHQIMPGQNELPHTAAIYEHTADPAFFVYALAKLGSSHSHLNPRMKNRAMCEIFGAYGYAEGVPFMKKLADHMLACGINRFVPHAFSPKYPDPDCPPHFYAGGHNPQFEPFGQLIRYMQRVIHLFEGSVHRAPVALYYNAECEWAGDSTDTYFAVAKQLTQRQVDFDFISEDYLLTATVADGKLTVNRESYERLVLPGCRYLTPRMTAFLRKLETAGVPFGFCGTAPEGFAAHVQREWPQGLALSAPAPHLRYYCTRRDGVTLYLFKNDGNTPVDTCVESLIGQEITVYDAWRNACFRLTDGRLCLEAGESVIWLCGESEGTLPPYRHPRQLYGEAAELRWEITVGDVTFADSPLFNVNAREGFTRYGGAIRYVTETEIPAGTVMLDLGAVGETATLTLNGVPCGSRISEPYAFDIGQAVKPGINRIEIEVVNNLGYRERDEFSVLMKLPAGGIQGPVRFLKQ